MLSAIALAATYTHDLAAAEQYRVAGQPYQAMELYDRAIAGALEHGAMSEAAVANECAAEFYLARHRLKIAQVYIRDCYQQYRQCGATAKVKRLEQRYPQ